MTEKIKITLDALKKNNMVPFYAEKKEDVLPILKTLIKEGDTVGLGGSVTLNELNIIEEIRNGNYNLIDRYAEGLSVEERIECYRKALLSDVFLTSTNAVTVKGELVNVDGTGNRVAALVYGPRSVIVIAGKNKIVDSCDEGFRRIKEIAAPKNCKRLDRHNYCFYKGYCMANDEGTGQITDGCNIDGRICCSYLVQGHQEVKNRIKVILCEEDLGY